MAVRDDRPVKDRQASSYSELWMIVTHPAFRLGFCDAQSGRLLDHDRIARRILTETPARALERMGWSGTLFSEDVALAQYRYEEGRLAYLDIGLRCKAWGHPDYPPAALRAFIADRAKAGIA